MTYSKYVLRKDPLIMKFEKSPALQNILSSGTVDSKLKGAKKGKNASGKRNNKK